MGTIGTATFIRMPRGVVLVVDDYAESRAAVRELLEDHGYQVAEAANGQEALNFLAAGAPRVELVILDLQMPVMNGWQFLTLLDSYVRLSTIPVLVVSAHAKLPDQRTHPGIVGCLKVPYRMADLLALVESCCRPSRARSTIEHGVLTPARDETLAPNPPDTDLVSSTSDDITQK